MEIFISIMVAVILLQTTYMVYRSTSKTTNAKGDVLLDTSVLIDGRILAIARSGLLSARLMVPRSVVRELQFMADKADHDKRERARYGLEVIEKLQELPMLTMEVVDDGTTSEHGVDEQLIVLARRSGAKLCTIDYNLNKAARVQGVEIININELAHALRVVHLPGEKISVLLVQPGQDKKQAVGYLDDGTMVVVDDARDLIGQSVAVEITRALQTTAGRMMFAKKEYSSKMRGEAESRGRMVSKETVRGETESLNRTSTKDSPVPTRTEADTEARSNSRRRTTRSAAKTPPEPVAPTANPERQRSNSRSSNRSSNRRPRSAEDTLVNLANK